jgi:hypothetical protein
MISRKDLNFIIKSNAAFNKKIDGILSSFVIADSH